MKKVLKYLAFLFLAAILLHFSFKGVEWDDFTFEIMDMDGARVDKILITLKKKAE